MSLAPESSKSVYCCQKFAFLCRGCACTARSYSDRLPNSLIYSSLRNLPHKYFCWTHLTVCYLLSGIVYVSRCTTQLPRLFTGMERYLNWSNKCPYSVKNNIVLLKTISKLSLNLTRTITIRLDISILQQNISIPYKTFELNTIQIHNFQNFMLRNMFVYCLSSPICRLFSNRLLTSKFTVRVNS